MDADVAKNAPSVYETWHMARWAVISGQDSAETVSCAMDIGDALVARGVRVAGFVQLRFRDEELRKGYELVRLADGQRVPLADPVVRRAPGDESRCTMKFVEASFALARGWLAEDAPAADVILIDRLGSTELGGGGHAAAFEWALKLPPDKVVVFCAKTADLSRIFERFSIGDEMVGGLELPADRVTATEFLRQLVAAVPEGRPEQTPRPRNAEPGRHLRVVG